MSYSSCGVMQDPKITTERPKEKTAPYVLTSVLTISVPLTVRGVRSFDNRGKTTEGKRQPVWSELFEAAHFKCS